MDKLYQYMHPFHDLNSKGSARPVTAGSCAWEIFQRNQSGTVLGITSKGIFVILSGRHIVFLSLEEYRGPLTINLPGLILPEAASGESVEIQDQNLIMAGMQIDLSSQSSQIWRAGQPSEPVTEAEQLSRLRRVAEVVVAEKDGAGLSSLLIPLLGMNSPVAVSKQSSDIMPVIDWAQKNLSEQKYLKAVFALEPIFGRGSGLTPSGDDLVLGLMLGLNRFPDLFCGNSALPEVNQTAIHLARKKTTSLAASLIECACRGQADERLIKGLDGVLSGFSDIEGCAQALCSWGNSSGADALVGLALLLTAPRQM